MEETTLNQEQESTTAVDDDGFFDDITDEEIDNLPVTDDFEDDVDAEGTQEEKPLDDDFLDIRYNKEDVRLNRDQAREYAQKGMNYDKLNERYSSLNSNLERLANANGLSVDEFLDRLEQTQWNFEVSKEMDSLREQYPVNEDASEEELAERERLLTELAEARTSQRIGDAQAQRQAQLQEQNYEINRQASDDVGKLLQLYPDLLQGGNIMANIPQEVMEMANENHDLTYSYSLWRAKQAELNKPAIEAKAKAQRLNTQNQSRNYGSTTNAGSTKQDDFLAGWNEG